MAYQPVQKYSYSAFDQFAPFSQMTQKVWQKFAIQTEKKTRKSGSGGGLWLSYVLELSAKLNYVLSLLFRLEQEYKVLEIQTFH